MPIKDSRNDKSFSEELSEMAYSIPPQGINLRNLLERLGERGSLTICMILTIPFLLPISIPGSSIPFGLIISFIGIGTLADRPPWLPKSLMNLHFQREKIIRILRKGARLFARIEMLIHPRFPVLTHKTTVERLNGIAMILSALLLMIPLPLPFSNTLPAYAVLFFAAGSLERDGYAIIIGYLMLLATIFYFALVVSFGFEVLGRSQGLFPLLF